MATKKGSWSVVSTIRAPQFMVDQFIEHYLKLGASEIHIFFDDPKCTDYNKNIKSNNKIKIYICDDQFWQTQPKPFPLPSIVRPENIENRQYANFMQAQTTCCTEWLLHVDVDELLHCIYDVKEILKNIPTNIFSVAAKAAEAIYTYIPDTEEVFLTDVFKTNVRDFNHVVKEIYPEDILPSKSGYWAYNGVKTFVRVSESIQSLMK